MKIFQNLLKLLSRIPKGLYIVIAIYIVTILALLPLHNSGFSDDFAYHHVVSNYLHTGVLKLDEWGAPSLVFQVFWAVLFSKLFGFSYITLQLSSIVLFLFGIIAFYFLLKEINVDDKKAVFFTCALFSTPLVLLYAVTFLTYIPYVSMLLITLYLSVLSLKKEKWYFSLLATLAGMSAFLIRQLGLGLPLVLLFVHLILFIQKRKFNIGILASIVLPTAIIYSLFNSWLNAGNITLGLMLTALDPLEKLKKYLFPFPLDNVNMTNSIYKEWFFGLGLYLQSLIFSIFPFLLFFKLPGLKEIKNYILCNKRACAVGLILLAFLYWRVMLESMIPDFSTFRIFRPMANFAQTTTVLFPNTDYYRNWNIIVFAGYPLAAIIIGVGIFRIFTILFEKRPHVFKKIFFVLLALFSGIFLRLTYNYARSAMSINIVEGPFALYIVWFSTLAASYIFCFYHLKTMNNSKNKSIILFLFLAGVIQVFLTLQNPRAWDEYTITFIPFVLLAMLGIFVNRKINLPVAIILLVISLYASIYYQRYTYQESGIQWEKDLKLVKEGKITPNQAASASGFSWMPYFYEEISFQRLLKKAHGNKRLVPTHTWNPPYLTDFKNYYKW